MAWHIEDPDRFVAEKGALVEIGFEVEVDEAALRDGQVVLNCTLLKDNLLDVDLKEGTVLNVHYPENYPYFRPEVYALDIDLPRHQNPYQKNLCLLARPTQFWDVGLTVAEFLKQQLRTVIEKGQITDPEKIAADAGEQAEPHSEFMSVRTNALVLSNRPAIFSAELPGDAKECQIVDEGELDIVHNQTTQNIRLVQVDNKGNKVNVSSARTGSSDILKIIVKEWRSSDREVISQLQDVLFDGPTRNTTIPWYQLTKAPKLEQIDTQSLNIQWFYDLLGKHESKRPKLLNIATKNYSIHNIIGLLFPEEIAAGEMGWGWVFLVSGNLKSGEIKVPNGQTCSICLPVMSLDTSDYEARIPQSANLRGKTISVIGLGTLGAPSVLEFAKNGVSKLILMDYDIVNTTGSVRWPLGIEYVGQLKIHALKQFINKNYPNVDVEVIEHKIGAAEILAYPNEDEQIEKFLGDTSLVYDGTAEIGVSNFLSSLCKWRKIPYMAIEGRRGGWGGLVMRVTPGSTEGCWMCMRNALKDGTIPRPMDDKNGGIQPMGCGDVSFTGSSFDMQNISLTGVRMAIHSLGDNYQDVSEQMQRDVAVLAMVDVNEKSIAPNWDFYPLAIHPDCPHCNE